MRKLKLFMHVSLDGFAAGPNGEIDWAKLDDEMFDLVKEFTDRTDTALYGRATWEMMDAYWPNAAEQPGATKHDKEHSAWYNSVEKIVLSNTMVSEKRDKTTFIGGDIATQINDLKQKDGKDILIFGSPGAARSLMKENLIDEYWLFVNPVILGQGISMFSKLDNRIELEHQASRVFPCGVTAMNFALLPPLTDS